MEMNLDDVEAATYGGAAHSGDISTVMDDFDFLSSHHAAAACSFPSSSSASTSFRSASLSCSPEISSTAPDVLSAPQMSLQFPEVSSFVAPAGVVLPYDDQYVASFHDTPAGMAPSGMSTRASAFRRYEQHLSPRRRLTKPACGQRMFKTAMSALEKMHTAMKYSQQQQNQQYYYQQPQEQMLAAESSGNQLQHMISERKRREKLNDSFHALKTVLPPGSKKDKTSILIIAREYLTSLKSKVSELEEKNQALQAQLAQRVTSGASADEDKTEAGEHVEIQITTAEGDQSGEICTVKIGMWPARSNTTDTVVRTLQCLKEQIGEDVSLMSMRIDDGPHRAILTLHLKLASGAKWEEETVREVVTKAVTGTPAP
ncbi:putative transcription factor bHLH041 [Lolium perenne]|uniref:putative transcription factor bHLH041 n=1 Tax=Lolium perenne TaxID=4522 RepID=UPI003A9A088D